MGFLDTLLGRTKPVPPKLDDLFALPSAAITLEAGTSFKPTGSGSVCFRPVEGRSFSDVQKDVQDLLDMSAGKEGGLPVEVTKDSYGFTWLVSSHMSDQLDALVKVSGDIAKIPSRDLRTAEPLNAFFFAPAMSLRGGTSLSTIFSTHPSLDKRIEQLAKIQRELGQPGADPRGIR